MGIYKDGVITSVVGVVKVRCTYFFLCINYRTLLLVTRPSKTHWPEAGSELLLSSHKKVLYKPPKATLK